MFLLCDAVSAGQRILEDAELGCGEGEECEEERDPAEKGEGKLGRVAYSHAAVELPRFVEVGDRRRDKEDRDVDPVGRTTDHSVVGVEQHGDQRETEKRALQLDAPEVIPLPKEKALHHSEKKHRPEQELHMLPCGLIHTRKGCDPQRAPRPIVQKMQQCADERCHRKSYPLP